MRAAIKMNTTTLKRFLGATSLGLLMLEPAMAQGGIAERERNRREGLVREAEQHLTDGRAAYAMGDYEKAVKEYRAALEKTPKGTLTQSRRTAIKNHLADGSIALATNYRKVGKYDEARDMLEGVLLVDPSNPDAVRELEYLDDPIRTNPALTYEHTQNVDKVRRLLYTAEGYYNLGQYDKAEAEYNNVLKIDPYNKASRRGLEKCAAIKSDYYRSAYDHARAELLMQVDKAWEMAVVPDLAEINTPQGQGSSARDRSSNISNKLKQIIIPNVDMEQMSVEEAIDELRQRSRELDTVELDPLKKGINFIIQKKSGGADTEGLGVELEAEGGFGGGSPSTRTVAELKLTNVPLGQVLQAICDQTGLRYRLGEHAITLLPNTGGVDDEVVTRTWTVTPTFRADLGGQSEGGGGGASSDPFAASSSDSDSSFKQQSVQELLALNGVEFKDGASANFIAATSTLIVRNTINNLDLVDNIVEQVNNQTPKQIKILTKFVEVSQNNTDELGFDWNLGI